MPERYTVIGTGKLGTALSGALQKAGHGVISLFNRSPDKAGKLADQFGRDIISGEWPDSVEQLGDVIFLCVPDDTIEKISLKLADEFDLTGKTLVHTSGTLPASILQTAKEKGAKTAAFHPLQTFSGSLGDDIFKGVPISIQGDEDVAIKLKSLAEELQAKPVIISESDKQRLHVAAVFASNYAVTLMDLAQQSVDDPELKKRVPELLYPLLTQTVLNLKEKGPAQSLTGPLSRGDKSTVAHHLDLLNKNPELAESYRFLAGRTLSLIERAATIDQKVIEQIRELFGGSGSKESD